MKKMSMEEFDELLRFVGREDISREDRRSMLLKNMDGLSLKCIKSMLQIIYPEYEPEPIKKLLHLRG